MVDYTCRLRKIGSRDRPLPCPWGNRHHLRVTIEAAVFDIGGVLEITPSLGVAEMWESRLGLQPGEINKRMQDVWEGGAIGAISERDVHQAVRERLGLDERQFEEFMGMIW